MSEKRTHTAWGCSVRPGETKTARNGTKITNKGTSTVKILIEIPVTDDSKEAKNDDHNPLR